MTKNVQEPRVLSKNQEGALMGGEALLNGDFTVAFIYLIYNRKSF